MHRACSMPEDALAADDTTWSIWAKADSLTEGLLLLFDPSVLRFPGTACFNLTTEQSRRSHHEQASSDAYRQHGGET